MFRQLAMLLLSSAIALLSVTAQAETLNIRLVLSDSSPPYQQFSAAITQVLAASKADVTVISSQAGNDKKADLIIAVGMKATESALNKLDTPVLGVMIPKLGYEALLNRLPSQPQPNTTSAIYIDQSWERQLDFLQAAIPNLHRIGLLYSPDTPIDIDSLRYNAKVRGLFLSAQAVQSGETLFAILDTVLGESDVLLAIPDSNIFNNSNVRNILLTSYRHKVALIGISQAYVSAGALCAIFSTPEQLAEQTVETIVSFARNRRLPKPQYPGSFNIALNQQVARSLEIALNSPEVIRERMNKNKAGEVRR